MTHQTQVRNLAATRGWKHTTPTQMTGPDEPEPSNLDLFTLRDYLLYVTYGHGCRVVDASFWTSDYQLIGAVESLTERERYGKVTSWLIDYAKPLES